MTSKQTTTDDEVNPSETLMEFPCVFPLKVFGRDRAQLEAAASDIIYHHIPDADITEIKARPSKTGKYIALTLTFRVFTKEQLEQIYLALSEHDAVIMTL